MDKIYEIVIKHKEMFTYNLFYRSIYSRICKYVYKNYYFNYKINFIKIILILQATGS